MVLEFGEGGTSFNEAEAIKPRNPRVSNPGEVLKALLQ